MVSCGELPNVLKNSTSYRESGRDFDCSISGGPSPAQVAQVDRPSSFCPYRLGKLAWKRAPGQWSSDAGSQEARRSAVEGPTGRYLACPSAATYPIGRPPAEQPAAQLPGYSVGCNGIHRHPNRRQDRSRPFAVPRLVADRSRGGAVCAEDNISNWTRQGSSRAPSGSRHVSNTRATTQPTCRYANEAV
jgi:hypothetical protein